MSVPDYYKNKIMCDKAVDNYPQGLEFIPDCYMICGKLIMLQCSLYVNARRLKKFVIKRLINALIDIRL